MKTILRLPLVSLLALCAGCSSFQEKWDAVGKPGRFQQASKWEGRWTSARHRVAGGAADGGRLRCVIEPKGDAAMLAHFRANWQVFSADYEVNFSPKRQRQPKQRGEVIELRGSHELPRAFGGTYRYDAQIAGDRFSARYDSSYDSGTFEMTRKLTKPTPIH